MSPKDAVTCVSVIDYKLNQLGIRVMPDKCQLIARSREGWVPIGLPQELPMRAPKGRDDLWIEVDSPLRITVYQYISAHRETDLADVLSQTKPFEQALKDHTSGVRP